MGNRAKLKRARRIVCDAILQAPNDAQLASEAVMLGILKPQKARELLRIRAEEEQRRKMLGL